MDKTSIHFKERVVINPAETKYQAKNFHKYWAGNSSPPELGLALRSH
jgi:hypothetical protein